MCDPEAVQARRFYADSLQYVWPKLDTIDAFHAKGMNTFRINFLAERLIPNKQDGPFDPVYFKDLKDVCPFLCETKWLGANLCPDC
jgi:hypothetical protein